MQLQSFDEGSGLGEKELSDATKDIEVREKEIRKARDRDLPGPQAEIEGYERTAESLMRQSGAESLEDFRKNLTLRQKAEKLRDEQDTVLKTYFGGGQAAEENIRKWEGKIGKLEGFKERAKDIVYDEAVVSQLRSGRQWQEKRRSELLSAMDAFKRQLMGNRGHCKQDIAASGGQVALRHLS